MTWLSLGQNLLVSVSRSKAVFNPQRYSQLKYMKKYVYLLKKEEEKESKDFGGFTFSNEQLFHWKIPDQS